MGGDQSSELKEHGLWACHKQGRAHHAKRNELGRDSEEEEPRLLASLVLGCSIAHGQDQCGQEEYAAEEPLRENLVCLLALRRKPQMLFPEHDNKGQWRSYVGRLKPHEITEIKSRVIHKDIPPCPHRGPALN